MLTVPVRADGRLEYQVKAGFLFNFLKFTDWPPGFQPEAGKPYRVAVYGDRDVYETVAGALRGKRLHDSPIEVTAVGPDVHGFSITQISDVHVGPTIRRDFVERLVGRVNDLRADLIAVTGDLVDGSVHQLAAHTAPLSKLSARHGAYFVTGNHEYYSGEAAWTREIRRLGLTVLKNQHVVLNHDGASLVLAGVNDFAAHHYDPAQRSDPAAALEGSPADAGARILLAHQPGSAQAAANAGYDVQISGHTHGGQFWPWNLFVRFFQPFTAGLHRVKNLWVYVSRGTGYWGPPNLLGVPADFPGTGGARGGGRARPRPGPLLLPGPLAP